LNSLCIYTNIFFYPLFFHKRTLVLPTALGVDVTLEHSAWMPPEAVLDLNKIRNNLGYKVVTRNYDQIPASLNWIDRKSTGKILIQQREASEISLVDFHTLESEKFVARHLAPEGLACRNQCECCAFSTCEQAPSDSPLRREFESLAYNFSLGFFDPPQIARAVERMTELIGNYSSVVLSRSFICLLCAHESAIYG